MTSDESRLEILKKVEDRTLSIEEGSELIGILDIARSKDSVRQVVDPLSSVDRPAFKESPQVSGCWKAAWSLILVGGAVLTGFSAYWVYQGYQCAGLGWGFWLSWIPFVIGVLIMVLGWMLMESPWLQVRINSRDSGKPFKLNIAIPLPLKVASWIFRTFGQYMPPEVKDKGIEEMIDEVENSLKRGEPFQVDVDDDKDGDQVHILISR